MALDSSKGYRALRHGRHSQEGCEYFITFCSEHRQAGLASKNVGPVIMAEIEQMETETIWLLRCAVIMPDHIHLLVRLGEKLTLGKAVARLKAKTNRPLRAVGLRWQAGYFDHQIRPKEDLLPVFLYIYLNPHKAKLLPTDCSWPWFSCGSGDREWFAGYLDKGLPEPTWLAGLP